MNRKQLLGVLLVASLALGVVTLMPTSSAHTCQSLIPSDCGPCTSGTHNHTYCHSQPIKFYGSYLP